MKQKILFLLPLFYFSTCVIVSAQFYNAFAGLFSLENESTAIEMGNGFVFGFTETNAKKNFHESILLIKTNVSGNIIWSRRYDAGAGNSLHLVEMIRTANNEILISGSAGPDNNFIGSNRCIIKLNGNGGFIWAKRYAPGYPYDSKGLVQLKDSSFVFSLMARGTFPGVLQIDKGGNILAKGQVTNRSFESIHSITAEGNTADIIVGDKNIVNINFKTRTPSFQRQYNTSTQFDCLLSARCSNGDIIYLAGRNSGGVLNGNSRVFRTSANGNLLWAKNIDAFYDNSGSVFSRFDIVSQVSIHEDINGNIVAIVQAESTQNLVIILNGAGKYLYNRFLNVPFSSLNEIKNGSYLYSAPAFNTSSGNAILSNRLLSALSGCDSAIIVKVSNGSDSSVTLDRLQFSTASITAGDIPLTVKDTNIQSSVFCDLANVGKKGNSQTALSITVMPNPAATTVMIKSAVDIPFCIYSLDGVLKIRSRTNQSTIINSLEPGVYSIVATINGEVIRRMMIKRD